MVTGNFSHSSLEQEDPLLDCLVILSQLHQRPYTREAFRAGLPLINNRFTPQIFIRAATRAGFTAKITRRSFSRISALVLPVVLLLKDNQACVLTKIEADNQIEIMVPETGAVAIKKSREELAQHYTGYAIFLTPVKESASVESHENKSERPVSWFWGTLWNYRFNYAQVVLAAFFINLFALISPLFVMIVYDRVIPNFAEVTLWSLVIGVSIIFIFDLVLRFLRTYIIDVCGKKADVLMATNLFQHVMGMQLANKPLSVGAFGNNLREFEVVREFFTSSTLSILVDIPFLSLYLLLIAYIGGIVVFIPLLAIPMVLGVALLIEIPVRRLSVQIYQGTAKKHGILMEALSGLEALKALLAEGRMQKKWEETVSSTARLMLKSRLLTGSVVNLMNLTQQFVTIFIIVVGVYQIAGNHLTLGGLIACNILASRTLAPLGQIANLLTHFQQAKVSLQGLNQIMELPQERPQQRQFIQQAPLKGSIEFANVDFQYPHQETKVLDNVSFKIEAGERVGLIGKIGSGKSTIQKLILGLYQPQKGAIYIDGIDSKQWDPIQLRQRIGYVSQDLYLFSGNVRDNIAITHPGAADQAILAAAQFAGVDQFVKRHPSGYEMPVTERGESLSGGQRQSIAIARALLNLPSVLLLDEPSSAMDERSEYELIMKFSRALSQQTLLLVTHRTSLLALVNRLIVMENGKIIMNGSKDEVIQSLTQQTSKKAAS